MIPRAHIMAWRTHAPWPSDAQVEQDLILCRALTEMYGRPELAAMLAFRGGTALHKLHFSPPGRYSEDIDLVQTMAGPIGPVLQEVHAALDPWLGEPSSKQNASSVKLIYRFESTTLPVQLMRLEGRNQYTRARCHTGPGCTRVHNRHALAQGHAATITTYGLAELLGTSFRALYPAQEGSRPVRPLVGADHSRRR